MSCSSKRFLFMFYNKPAPTLKEICAISLMEIFKDWNKISTSAAQFEKLKSLMRVQNSCTFFALVLWLHTAPYKTAKNVSILFYLDSIWLMNLSKLKQSVDAGMKAWALAEVTIRNVTNITTDRSPKWANLKNGSFGVRVRVSGCRQQ